MIYFFRSIDRNLTLYNCANNSQFSNNTLNNVI